MHFFVKSNFLYLSPPGVSHGAGILPDTLTAAVGGTVMFTTTVPPLETPPLVVIWGLEDSSGSNFNIITSSGTNVSDPG